ncbi:MAG: hypothetical protein RBT81_02465 [Gammaproteobacteria bacterium]|jgi:tetratricopeptide (TPR) repeat protein|nr:hypothetical protein [Gammaproteobacteria bacterium]
MRPMIFLLAIFCCLSAFAEPVANAPKDVVPGLYRAWDQIRSSTPEAQRKRALLDLRKSAEGWLKQYPEDPGLLIWTGIITSSYAGAAGGLSALGAAKDARASFERALQIHPGAQDGAAYTSLGSLYSQVPGWPLGFGNDDKAEDLLRKGLEVNPAGMDANYFYADHLARQGRWSLARTHLERARSAPPRPDRPLADQARLAEIDSLLKEVEAKDASASKP